VDLAVKSRTLLAGISLFNCMCVGHVGLGYPDLWFKCGCEDNRMQTCSYKAKSSADEGSFHGPVFVLSHNSQQYHGWNDNRMDICSHEAISSADEGPFYGSSFVLPHSPQQYQAER
jgi:hypothetical protein